MLLASLPVSAINAHPSGFVYCPLQKKWVSPATPKTVPTFNSGHFCVSSSTKEKAARALFLAAAAISEDNFFAAISGEKLYSSPIPKNNSELLAGSHTQPLTNGNSSSLDKLAATTNYFVLPISAEAFAELSNTPNYLTVLNFTSRSIPNSPTRGPPANI